MKIIALTFSILLIALPVYSEINLIQSTLISYTQNGFFESAIPFDSDNDGDYDFFASQYDNNSSDSYTYYYENTETGFFASFLGADETGAEFCGAVDIDNDGDVDVIAYQRNLSLWMGTAVIFRNEGNNTFSETQIELTNGTDRFRLIDIDFDGDLDIASADDYQVYYVENTDGYFTSSLVPIIIDGDSYFESNATDFADFDGDNDIDFIAIREDGDEYPIHFYYYENAGDLEFDVSQVSEIYDYDFPSIKLCDIDGDGDLDFICVGWAPDSGGEFVWWENQNNNFTCRELFDGEWYSRPNISNVADFDNDGDLNLIADNRIDERITVFENDGNGGFSSFHEIDGSSDATETRIIDYDFDGDLDMLTVRYSLKLYRNTMYNAVDQQAPSTTYETMSVYPNPFNASANLSVITQKEGNLEISLFNLLGQKVSTITNQNYSPGKHFFSLNGTNLNSGNYFIQAKSSSGDVHSRKIMLLK